MPKRPPAVAAIGRVQAERPPAPQETARQVDGPRALLGALLVPIEQIVPDPGQPRRDVESGALAELAASLKEYGVLQPLLVHEAGLLDDGRTRYMIVAGGRRYAAAQQAGLARLPLVVRESEGATLRVTQLVENIQRQDLAPLDEARAFKELMDADALTAADLSKRLHISDQKVRDRLLMLSDPVISDAVERGLVTPTVARDVLRSADEIRTPLRARIAAGGPIDTTDVQQARAQAAAVGVTNPRSSGGGRGARKERSRSLLPPSREHTAYAQSAPSGEETPPTPDPVQVLYEAFKAWEARVSQLPPADLQRLVGLIHGDMQSFMESVTEMTSKGSRANNISSQGKESVTLGP